MPRTLPERVRRREFASDFAVGIRADSARLADLLGIEQDAPTPPVILRADRAPPHAAASPGKGIAFGLALAVALFGCIVRRVSGPQLTGTCEGACTHYLQCKPGNTAADRTRCETECPGVFSDRDSLMAFESLSCDDAVEFVDGTVAQTAVHRGG